MLNQFHMISGLCPNLSKCEIAGISSLKNTKVIKIKIKTKESIKILGVHISYIKNFRMI